MKASKPNQPKGTGFPLIYEINTFVWLRELSEQYGKKITLANIPVKALDHLSEFGFNAIWLMGVWKRSPAGTEVAQKHDGIMKNLRETLPDLDETDISGSAYCIRDYQADPFTGGAKALAKFRKELSARGMKLILDFVPNHVAPDHPWTRSKPEYFIHGNEEEFTFLPDHYYPCGKHFFARARDPYYPPWPDVLQLNLFQEGVRAELVTTVMDIASQCDGIRCDMAMLVMNDIFSKTWSNKAGHFPGTDFWEDLIPKIKEKYPDFIFIAESYWDTEQALIAQGFDFCYDKRYYDDLQENAEKAFNHLFDTLHFQDHLLRFIENHDEPRAAGRFGTFRSMALGAAALTLPGAKLVHDGQITGRTAKVPVFLNRRPEEPESGQIRKFYSNLLKTLRFEAVQNGKWSFCQVYGWPDNQSCLNLLAWEWISEHESLMVIVNVSSQPVQAMVKSGQAFITGRTYQLYDVISGDLYRRDGEELSGPGIYVILPAWGMHLFNIEC